MAARRRAPGKRPRDRRGRTPGTPSTGRTPSLPPADSTPRRASPTGYSSVRYKVYLRYRKDGEFHEFFVPVDDKSFSPIVQHWRYVIANRRRITRGTRDEFSDSALEWLQTATRLDPDTLKAHIKEMAGSPVVEVRIPYSEERVGWSARLFPWESALWLLTLPYRSETSDFSVIRHLQCTNVPVPDSRPPSALIVSSSPGNLASIYRIDREAELVRDAFGAIKANVLPDPDRDTLRSHIQQSPTVIHLAGVDPLALEANALAKVSVEQSDGFVLQGTKGSTYDIVSADELAGIVTSGAQMPQLVSVSSCFSAPRVAALATAHGAWHSIGFQDVVTDADAMLFFCHFYREWAIDRNILRAFLTARSAWIGQPTGQNTQRSGVVLWSRVSLLYEAAVPQVATESPGTRRTPATEDCATPEDLVLDISLIQDKIIEGGIRPVTRTSLNYSLLHNDRSPFSAFTLDKRKAGKLPPLQVEVALEVGSDVCRCRFSEQLPESIGPIDLRDKVRLPLVAGLLRQCSESLKSNLYISIKCGERIIRESSERVTVLPADEWRDDGEDHRWLPSFVLPRDPAVLRVVSSAQRYLRTLLDDCTAGFDGYQQLDQFDTNAAQVVDPQVQAIWATLQHDSPVSYINPPPSYSSQSQRLRTPSEIFKGNAATCIDLALLFASCLEFVGIYATVFLISGHAFPGYWRSDKAWLGMRKFKFDAVGETPVAIDAPHWDAATLQAPTDVKKGQIEGWMFTLDNLSELLGYVQNGMLVPFESTFVTQRRGFFGALEEGSSRLHPDTFDAMIDIQSARGEKVTPLPLMDALTMASHGRT